MELSVPIIIKSECRNLAQNTHRLHPSGIVGRMTKGHSEIIKTNTSPQYLCFRSQEKYFKLGEILHFERSLGYLLALFYKGDGVMRCLTNYLHLAFNIVHRYDPLRTGTYKAFALRLFWKSNTSPVHQSKINVTASCNASLLTLKYRFFNYLQRTYILVSDTPPSAHSHKLFLSFFVMSEL